MTNDEYIRKQPEELQKVLRQINECIRAAAPEATKRFSYQMPCFYLGKTLLCGYGVFKKHIGFYPGSEPVGAFAERLEGYDASKGTVQFPLGQPVDFQLIFDMIRWKAEHFKKG